MKRLVLAVGLAACASADNVAPGIDAAVGRIDAAVSHTDAGPTPDAAPIVGNCATAVTCASAQSVGTVSGDTGADMLTADGYQAGWFRVRVTEDFSDAPGLALRVASKLTVPSGAAFDTFVYVNAASDAVECSTTIGTVMNTGNVKEVRAEWGEGFIPNGADDGRDVTIEVRPATGTSCSVAQSWHLEIDGNWL